ncbi:hypothetical protein GJW-30_1_03090 [Variibacter gotjawalensis]|uniref:Uncharacterized protein n=1 Tax=Variibacter gotjawalensis TaxID=1333996 RepID=A0A0S3PXQ8_9BRAD|nr:hypothetical protein [Variibacter gotjawalensis]RZS48284.1 hypothetical protein EV661_0692 [Variibacter gotjawalensis]BAT60544.1 hypothetical protein GJW-30_1_03090 [Variibacter gotjawalensis]
MDGVAIHKITAQGRWSVHPVFPVLGLRAFPERFEEAWHQEEAWNGRRELARRCGFT